MTKYDLEQMAMALLRAADSLKECGPDAIGYIEIELLEAKSEIVAALDRLAKERKVA